MVNVLQQWGFSLMVHTLILNDPITTITTWSTHASARGPISGVHAGCEHCVRFMWLSDPIDLVTWSSRNRHIDPLPVPRNQHIDLTSCSVSSHLHGIPAESPWLSLTSSSVWHWRLSWHDNLWARCTEGLSDGYKPRVAGLAVRAAVLKGNQRGLQDFLQKGDFHPWQARKKTTPHHASRQEVSRCRTRDESEDSIAHRRGRT